MESSFAVLKRETGIGSIFLRKVSKMEDFKIEIRFKAETDKLNTQIERQLLSLLNSKLDWIEENTLDVKLMERSEK